MLLGQVQLFLLIKLLLVKRISFSTQNKCLSDAGERLCHFYTVFALYNLKGADTSIPSSQSIVALCLIKLHRVLNFL